MDTANPTSAPVSILNVRDPAFLRDPYPTYHRLRTGGPIQWLPGLGLWIVPSYRLCTALIKDKRFGKNAVRVMERIHGANSMSEPVLACFHLSMAMQDPPNHTRLRGLVTQAFTARRVEDMRPRIRVLVECLLDRIAPRGAMDVIRDFAHALPVTVICEMLGIPDEDRHQFLNGIVAAGRILDPVPLTRSELDAANGRLAEGRDYFDHLFARRRRNPADDLISALVHAEDDAGKLTEDELFANVWLLLIAGHVTTKNLIGNGLLALHRHPIELQRLKARPDLLPPAVEELLRYDSPVQLGRRIALEDAEIEGVTVTRGQLVFLLVGAANRDPAEFAEPDRLNVARPGVRALSFGGGIHHCLGAQLSRIEVEIALATLFRRLPGLVLDGIDDPDWMPTWAIRGLRALPAHW